ncbi:hypothetical protein, partial [Thiohalocapsa halophila]|uniref:hypothetical protein n=1 Tax=Thiohalocapsa halophila TaxID=69359 RepID=UPI001904152B
MPTMPAAASTAGKDEPSDAIEIELNKLEPAADACRPYLVFHNRGTTALDALTLELVLFDADGFILRHFTLDAAPLAAGKTSVKLFEIPGVACNAIGRILLNQVTACAGADGALDDCQQRIRAASRLPAAILNLPPWRSGAASRRRRRGLQGLVHEVEELLPGVERPVQR